MRNEHTGKQNWKSSAVADFNSEVLCANVLRIDEVLKTFPEIRRYMIDVATEKSVYYETLIKQCVIKCRDEKKLKFELDYRLSPEKRYVTTRISLKRQRIRKLRGIESLKDLRSIQKHQKRLKDARMIVDEQTGTLSSVSEISAPLTPIKMYEMSGAMSQLIFTNIVGQEAAN